MRGVLTVRELLSLPTLRDCTVRAGESGLDRLVTAADVIEVPEIVKWARPGTLMFTTLYALKDMPDRWEELVKDLADAGIAGLAIKPNRYVVGFPHSILRAGDAANLPVLEIPFKYAHADLISRVFQALAQQTLKDLSHGYQKIWRVLNMLEQQETPSLGDTVRELQDITGVAITVHPLDQSPRDGSRRQPPGEVIPGTSAKMEIHPSPPPPVRRAIAHVLMVTIRNHHLQLAERMVLGGKILAGIQNGDTFPIPGMPVWSQLWGPNAPTHAQIVLFKITTSNSVRSLSSSIFWPFTRLETTFAIVVAYVDDLLVFLVSGDTALDPATLHRYFDPLIARAVITCGAVSQTFPATKFLPTLSRSLKALTQDARPGSIVQVPVENPVSETLHGLASHDGLSRYRTDFLHRIQHEGRGKWLKTLQAYFRCQQNIACAARLLGIHPHTVLNHLTKIQHATGFDLTDPDHNCLVHIMISTLDESVTSST